jgi:CBS-domain-containing membrane protein
MRQQKSESENTLSPIATVFPTDTLLHALRVMEQHHVRLLAVVGETGVLLGLVDETHLLEGWGEDPLLPVAAVMALCARPLRLGRGWRWTREARDERLEQARGA